jgi:predicted nucleic acid-binding protein
MRGSHLDKYHGDSNIVRDIISFVMRLVLDTTIVVAAIRSDRGASQRLLTAALQRSRPLTLLLSVPLLFEYEAVMTRPMHLRVSRLSASDVGVLLDAIAVVAEPVKLAFLWRPILPDGDDDMVLEAAVNGRADGIVTFNRRDFAPASRLFGLAVMSPGEALARLEGKTR